MLGSLTSLQVCRTELSLQGREAFVREQLGVQYDKLMSSHSHRAVDERAQTHLQAGEAQSRGLYCQFRRT